MRPLLALAVLLAPLAALADPPSRPVRVTNFPEPGPGCVLRRKSRA